MPSNDDVILDMPSATCPSCGCLFDLSKNRFDKYTKQQRKQMNQATNYESASTPTRGYSPDPFPTGEDTPSEAPEKNFVVLSCGNMHCDQYNKFKVLRIPRLATPSVKVDLND